MCFRAARRSVVFKHALQEPDDGRGRHECCREARSPGDPGWTTATRVPWHAHRHGRRSVKRDEISYSEPGHSPAARCRSLALCSGKLRWPHPLRGLRRIDDHHGSEMAE